MSLKDHSRPAVLIVDDNSLNIDVMLEILGTDYDISVAINGQQALEIVRKRDFDLILLDVMMPGISGHEVCQRLSTDPTTMEIPVIFVTTLDQSTSEVKGFEVGAVDYIAKPFVPSILRSRVKTHINLRRMQKELHRHNDRLEEMVEQRTRELASAHTRLKELDSAKDDFLLAISHELRTPANGVLGIGELAIEEIQDIEFREDLQSGFEQASERLLKTIDSALLLAKLEAGDSEIASESVALDEIIPAAIERAVSHAAGRYVSILPPDFHDQIVYTNIELATDVFGTLLKTAILLSAERSLLQIEIQETDSETILLFIATGMVLSEDSLQTFFDTFSSERTCSSVEELGLAIPLARRLMQVMGGTAEVRNNGETGVTLSLHFPKREEEKSLQI